MFKVNNNYTRTYFTPCSSVFIVTFEHVNAGWGYAIPLFHSFQVPVKLLPKFKRLPAKFSNFVGCSTVVENCICWSVVQVAT